MSTKTDSSMKMNPNDEYIFGCRRKDLRGAMRVVYTMLKGMDRSPETVKLAQDFAFTINSMCWKPLVKEEDPPISERKSANEQFIEIEEELDEADLEYVRAHLNKYIQRAQQAGYSQYGTRVVKDFMEFSEFLENEAEPEAEADLESQCEPCAEQPEGDSVPKKKPRSKKSESGPKFQCEARIWGKLHDGCERCSKGAGPTGLCGQHAKLEAECSIPCTVSEDGSKRVGLYMGRINQFQEGDTEDNLPPYMDSNGYVRTHWCSPRMVRQVREGIREGRCTLPIRGIGSSSSLLKIPSSANLEECFDMH